MFNKLIATVILLLNSVFVNAALVDNGTFVTDTNANTDYLKLSQTIGFSYDDVVTNDLLGFIADGWSLTSQASLKALATGPNGGEGYTLIAVSCGLPSFCQVITNNDDNGGQPGLPLFLSFDRWVTGVGYIGAYDIQSPSSTTFASSPLAVSLSRTAANVVPVPAAGYLFMAALAGLFGRKRFAK